MKTKSFGRHIYIVKKYYRTEEGNMAVNMSSWSKAENAFVEAQRHEKKHGENTAFVFKAKQCMEIE